MYWNELIEFALKTMGPERLMFSIDYPLEASKPSVDWIRQLPISDTDKASIMSANARRLFNIGT